MSQPTFANGLGGGFARILKEEGVAGFYAGFGPILFKQVPYTMAKFAVFEVAFENICSMSGKKPAELSGGQKTSYSLGAGVIAGLAAAAISQPADTLLSRMNKTKGEPGQGMVSRLATLSKQLGVKGLFGGMSARFVMIGTLTAAQVRPPSGLRLGLGIPLADPDSVIPVVISSVSTDPSSPPSEPPEVSRSPRPKSVPSELVRPVVACVGGRKGESACSVRRC